VPPGAPIHPVNTPETAGAIGGYRGIKASQKKCDGKVESFPGLIVQPGIAGHPVLTASQRKDVDGGQARPWTRKIGLLEKTPMRFCLVTPTRQSWRRGLFRSSVESGLGMKSGSGKSIAAPSAEILFFFFSSVTTRQRVLETWLET